MPHRGATPEEPSDLGDFLRRRQDEILAEWARAARALPRIGGLSRAALIDYLPPLLEKIGDMADDLARGRSPTLPRAQVEQHAHDRLSQGLDLADVVAEFALLRVCMIRMFEQEEHDRAQESLLLLNQVIDAAIAEAVDRFTEAQNRTMHALDRISSAALESRDLDELLERLLQVFVETTEAVDTAAILLREQDTLRVRASVGLDREAARRFSLRVGEGFAGKVAAERQPVFLQAAALDSLVKNELLRAKGLRALCGVPLVHEGEVIGVAHMGSCTAPGFSDQDQRLFRAMAHRVTSALILHRVRDRARRVAEILELGDACFVLDASWRVTFVNRNQEQLSRKPRAETLGRVFWDIWPDAAAPHSRYWTEYHRAMEERVPVEFDEYYAPLDLWTAMSVHPLHDGGIAVFVRDATERKRVEEAVAEARAEVDAAHERWRSLFMQAPLPIVLLWGAELVIEFANPSYAELVGRGLRLGRPLREILPDIPERNLDTVARVYRTGEAQVEREVPIRLDWADGRGVRERYFNVFSSPYRDAQGRIVGVMVCIIEVTDDVLARRRIEELLRQVDFERGRLDQILRQLPVGVLLAEPSGRISLQNPAAEQIWQHSLAEAEDAFEYRLGRVLRADRRAYERGMLPVARSLRDGEVVTGEELVLVRNDGTTAVVTVNSAPIRDPEGNIVAGVVAAMDISARKEQERRTAEAAEWQERMIGVLGHDLRSPLSTIAVAAESALLHGALPEHLRNALARIQSAAYRMGHMITEIVDWTQARLGGGFPLSPRAADLGDICERIVSELQAAHPGSRIVLERHGACDGMWDQARLAQVVQNLVGNAVQHGAPEHPVRVSVACADDRVVLEVHNAGAPIPPESMPRIFEPFTRLERRPTSDRTSLGLGLYIVREIVRAHDGRVEVRSSEPEGTTFTVTLPRKLPEREACDSREARPHRDVPER